MNFVFSLALSCAGIFLVAGFTANRNSIIPRNYADVVDLRALCEECIKEGGAGYYAHPTRCELFVHCYEGNSTVMAAEKECGVHQMWDQDIMNCNYEREIQCEMDPCRNGKSKISHARLCNAYYECGVPRIQKCCPMGSWFSDEAEDCVEDTTNTCIRPCEPGTADDMFEWKCDKEEVADDERFYKVVANGISYRMQCAGGTIFVPQNCSCLIGTPKRGRLLSGDEFCEPYVYIPLTDNLLDNGPNKKSVMSRGVQIVDRSAEFMSNGKITVMALNNMDFLSSFALSFRFRSSGEMTQGNYALIDNSDCDRNATFGVALVKGSQNRETIVGGFILTDGSFIRTDGITVTSGQWHEVRFMKKDSLIQLSVDGEKREKQGKADIKRLSCGMTIGSGTGLDPFAGFIDEINFYKCIPDGFEI